MRLNVDREADRRLLEDGLKVIVFLDEKLMNMVLAADDTAGWIEVRDENVPLIVRGDEIEIPRRRLYGPVRMVAVHWPTTIPLPKRLNNLLLAHCTGTRA